jgi:hypothetical protein
VLAAQRFSIRCGKQALFKNRIASHAFSASTSDRLDGSEATTSRSIRRQKKVFRRRLPFAPHKPICAELRKPSGTFGAPSRGVDASPTMLDRDRSPKENARCEAGVFSFAGWRGTQSSSPSISSA